MSALIAWLPALGPLALLLVGLAIPTARANAEPRAMARRARLAAFVALGASLATGIAVIVSGPLYTGTLGIGGVGLALYADAFSALMLVLVSFVGTIVVAYSKNYLDGDENQGRFFKRLCVTLAAALLLMGSGNLFQLALAWIATSLALHQLLVFYKDRPQAVLAARKKAIASRAGDAALLVAAALLLGVFGTLEIPVILVEAATMAQAGTAPGAVHVAVFLVVVAALVKSAQFPLHGWLGEVMETPTPVSALLHAGIINAGGFLVVRLSPLVVLSAPSMDVLALIGGFTALFGSLVMLTVPSVKVALAYSTIAQMGFMLLQCGLGAFSAAALHIVAHALYKAHAFLSSGSAVETIRSAAPAGPATLPNPAIYAATLAASIALTLAVGALFGTSVLDNPGAFALAAVVALGVAHYLASVLAGENAAKAMGSALGLATLVVVAYYALQTGAEALLAGAVAPNLALEGTFDGLVVTLVVASFAAALALQTFAPALSRHRAFAALSVHLANGLYVNAYATRLVSRLAPVTAKKS
ncbi:proton-conducting transporter transmembrane domain-containing protein [Salinarimonas ramus]|uniref:Probable inorganic carbon transporter subunit DabB n=1 Tax=Salinarimonas ramus TaxID=690164 RepID=A0A917QK42_9HYPH|nr:proton-conducting transporter membrane subunit [Salinarimonas ramus]GGK54194.1 NADH dehydrogenase [Salinarimonas ramus]